MATNKTKIGRGQKANVAGQNLSNGKSASSITNGSSRPKETAGKRIPAPEADKKSITLKAFAAAYKTHQRKAF